MIQHLVRKQISPILHLSEPEWSFVCMKWLQQLPVTNSKQNHKTSKKQNLTS